MLSSDSKIWCTRLSSKVDPTLAALQARIGYQFQDIEGLKLALSHRSYSAQNNERLEFLGDSILDLVVGEALFERHPELREGELSRMRSALVKGKSLAAMAREFELGPVLRMGSGEQNNGGRERDSLLADALEALVGAIYRDGGFECCRQCVLQWFESRLQRAQGDRRLQQKDPKTRLQEWLQARKKPLPKYSVVETRGAEHNMQFTVECRLAPLQKPVTGSGLSRRQAEQDAAKTALQALSQEEHSAS